MSQEKSQSAPIPKLGDLNNAYTEIIKHNSEHTGMGASMANMLIALVESSEPLDPNKPTQAEPVEDQVKFEEKMEQAVTEGDMHGELQGILHEDIFMRIGVEVSPTGSYVGNGLGERSTSTSLVPRVTNTELYRDFLTTVKPEDLQKSEDQEMLVGLLVNLKSTVEKCFDPNEIEKVPEELRLVVAAAGEDALRTFIAVAPEYQRLGLDAESLRAKYPTKPDGPRYLWLPENPTQEQVNQQNAHRSYDQAQAGADTFESMENYVSYWGRNVLPEYIVATRGQYLRSPKSQGFGPAQWHCDGGQPSWGKALAFVAELAQDGRTRDFAEEVRKGLVSSLDFAIAEIDGHDDNEPLHFANQRDDLANIRDALTGQKFDAVRLEEYTKPPNYEIS